MIKYIRITVAALVYLSVFMAHHGVLAEERPVVGTVTSAETGYRVLFSVKNWAEVPLQNISIAPSSIPEGLIHFSIDPATVDNLPAGDSASFMVSFDVADDAEPRDYAEIAFIVSAENCQFDLPSPTVAVAIVARQPNSAKQDPSITATKKQPAPYFPLTLRLVNVDAPHDSLAIAGRNCTISYSQGQAGLTASCEPKTEMHPRENMVSAGFIDFPQKIILGQPFTFTASWQWQTRFQTEDYCSNRYKNEPRSRSNCLQGALTPAVFWGWSGNGPVLFPQTDTNSKAHAQIEFTPQTCTIGNTSISCNSQEGQDKLNGLQPVDVLYTYSIKSIPASVTRKKQLFFHPKYLAATPEGFANVTDPLNELIEDDWQEYARKAFEEFDNIYGLRVKLYFAYPEGAITFEYRPVKEGDKLLAEIPMYVHPGLTHQVTTQSPSQPTEDHSTSQKTKAHTDSKEPPGLKEVTGKNGEPRRKPQLEVPKLSTMVAAIQQLARRAGEIRKQGDQQKISLQTSNTLFEKTKATLGPQWDAVNTLVEKGRATLDDCREQIRKMAKIHLVLKDYVTQLENLHRDIEKKTTPVCDNAATIGRKKSRQEIHNSHAQAQVEFTEINRLFLAAEDIGFRLDQEQKNAISQEATNPEAAANSHLATLDDTLHRLKTSIKTLIDATPIPENILDTGQKMGREMEKIVAEAEQISSIIQTDLQPISDRDKIHARLIQSLNEQIAKDNEHLQQTLPFIHHLQQLHATNTKRILEQLSDAQNNRATQDMELRKLFPLTGNATPSRAKSAEQARQRIGKKISNARNQAYDCFNRITSVLKAQSTPLQQLAAADCSQFSGTAAQWDEEEQAVFCNCPEGIDWNETERRCIDNSPAGQLARADCTAFPGTSAEWDEEEQTVRCNCQDTMTWNDATNSCLDMSPASQVARFDCSAYSGTIAQWNSAVNSPQCLCSSGWSWDKKQKKCIDTSPSAQVARLDCSAYPGMKARWETGNHKAQCACPSGLEWDNQEKRCLDNSINGKLARADCSAHGKYVEKYWSDAENRVRCRCTNGYIPDSRNICVEKTVTSVKEDVTQLHICKDPAIDDDAEILRCAPIYGCDSGYAGLRQNHFCGKKGYSIITVNAVDHYACNDEKFQDCYVKSSATIKERTDKGNGSYTITFVDSNGWWTIVPSK